MNYLALLPDDMLIEIFKRDHGCIAPIIFMKLKSNQQLAIYMASSLACGNKNVCKLLINELPYLSYFVSNDKFTLFKYYGNNFVNISISIGDNIEVRIGNNYLGIENINQLLTFYGLIHSNGIYYYDVRKHFNFGAKYIIN